MDIYIWLTLGVIVFGIFLVTILRGFVKRVTEPNQKLKEKVINLEERVRRLEEK